MLGLETIKRKMFLKKAARVCADYTAITQDLLDNHKEDYAKIVFAGRDAVGTEMATGPSDLISAGYEVVSYNPDDLVGKKGLEIFDDMKKDDQVKPALFIKKLARLSTPWKVKPASKSKEDIAIAEFYEDCLTNLPGTFIKVLFGAMSCLDYGFSISEINYKYIKSGLYKGKIGLKSIKSKKPHDFDFKLDEFVNVESLIQNQMTQSEVALPPEKFIIWTNDAEWENPYGVSDLKAAYRPWWMKDVVTKFQGIFLERYPSPIMIGRYPHGLAQQAKDALLEVLEDLQVKTAGIVPQGVVIETIEVGKTGSGIYERAIEKYDKMICRSLLVPDLLGMTETPSKGSYALGKKHFDVFLWVLFFLGKTTEEIFHEQLTIPLIDLNFQVQHYPKLLLEEITEESMEIKSKILGQLTQAGFIDPQDQVHREWASNFLHILPSADTQASAMAHEAIDFSVPYKFYSPDRHDSFEVEILEQTARLELMEDAFSKS